MKPVFTSKAPSPAGHYHQAIVHQGLVYVSGQLPHPIDPDGRRPATIEEQARQVFANLEAVLDAAGSGLEYVVKTTAYISDISLWDRVNAIYAEVFKDHKPARAIVPTKELHFGFQLEIDAVAAVRSA